MATAKAKESTAGRFVDGSVSLAILLIISFYGLMSLESMNGSLIHKYTTEHATEYVIVAMLAWGVADLFLRCLSFRAELRALKHRWLPDQARAGAGRDGQRAFSRLAGRFQVGCKQRGSASACNRLSSTFTSGNRPTVSTTTCATSPSAMPRRRTPITACRGSWSGSRRCWAFWARWFTSARPWEASLPTTWPRTCRSSWPAWVRPSTRPPWPWPPRSPSCLACSWWSATELGIVQEIDAWIERNLSNRFAVEDAELAPFLRAIEAASRTTLATVQESWSKLIAHQHQRDEAHEQHLEERLRQVPGWLCQPADRASDAAASDGRPDRRRAEAPGPARPRRCPACCRASTSFCRCRRAWRKTCASCSRRSSSTRRSTA